MATDAQTKPMKIGISTRDFLDLPGARDFLRYVIRGLRQSDAHQLYLLMDAAVSEPAPSWSNAIIRIVGKVISIPSGIRNEMRKTEVEIRRRFKIGVSYFPMAPLRRKAVRLLGADTVRGIKILPHNNLTSGILTAIRRQGIDVVIPTLLHDLPVNCVAYLYDCQHRYHPENFSPADIALRDKYFTQLIKASKALIVNSRQVKSDLMKFYEADGEKIVALPFAPQLGAGVIHTRPRLLKKYRLPARFFLISNQFWVHKSLETALEALRMLIDQGLTDCHIVFTGQMEDTRFPDYVPRLMETVKQLDVDRHTTFLGYIPKRDQLEIMKHAVAVIQTTLFEGGPGGGSIYDAVALGVRGIVSDIPVNRELPVSDALVLFEPRNARDLSDKMNAFWDNEYVRPEDRELLRHEHEGMQNLSRALYAAIEKAASGPAPMEKPSSTVIHGKDTLVSVITVCKNADKQLRKTIDSVFAQCHPKMEYILVDGGSTDKTIDIIKSYDGRIKYVSEPDEGIYDAMNKGIAMAGGDILYFLNAGDVLFDRHVFKDVLSVIADPAYRQYGFFYGDVQFTSPDGIDGRFLRYDFFPFYYYAFNCQCHQVCFYRREMFEQYGNYDSSFRVYGDQEFNARLVVKNQVPSLQLYRTIVRYQEGGFSAEAYEQGISAMEKEKIKKRYFGDVPEWFWKLPCGFNPDEKVYIKDQCRNNVPEWFWSRLDKEL